jgi:hypothetical protein
MLNEKRNTEHSAVWKKEKAKLKAAFPALTNSDLNFEFARKHEMLSKLARKLGKTTPELLMIIEKD